MKQKLVWTHKSCFHSIHDHRRRIVHPKFRHDVFSVSGRGVRTEEQLLIYLGIGHAFCDELQYFCFSGTEHDWITRKRQIVQIFYIDGLLTNLVQDLTTEKGASIGGLSYCIFYLS